MATTAIALRNLSHRYPADGRETLAIADLRVGAGEHTALIGASGAGKSTLLRLLDGRLRGWSGEASVLGHVLEPNARPPRSWHCEIGFVFQEFALIEQATVRQNVLNGRLGRTDPWWSLLGQFKCEDEVAAAEAMEDVGIGEFAGRRVDRLSGGQRQRVAIARCLAQNPRLILADEPVSNLDPVLAETILALLRDCARRRGAALLVTSHQPRLVARYVDRFVALDRGRIAFDGSPEALHEGMLAGIYENATKQPAPEPVA